MSGHNLVSWKVYFANFCVLVFLMILTVVAYTWELGRWNLPLAMGIAITKASFIIMIFMNVHWSSKLTKVFAAAGFFWFLILMGFLYVDYSQPQLGHIYSDVQNIGVHPFDADSAAAHVEPVDGHDAEPAQEPAEH